MPADAWGPFGPLIHEITEEEGEFLLPRAKSASLRAPPAHEFQKAENCELRPKSSSGIVGYLGHSAKRASSLRLLL